VNKKNIVLLSYGILTQDGRLAEIEKTLKLVGDCTIIAVTLPEVDFSYGHECRLFVINKRDDRGKFYTYARFVWHSIELLWKDRKSIDILFVDDFTVALIAHLAISLIKPKFVIQDSRELYIDRKMPGLGCIHVLLEKMLYKRVDLISCANIERAKCMQRFYGMKKRPLVYANIREFFLNATSTANKSKLEQLVKNNMTNIISTGGYSVERGSLKLLETMRGLDTHNLVIVGGGAKKDFDLLNRYIQDEKINNVVLVGRVSLNDLSVLVSLCDIGYVEYHMNDINNRFCASGKIYEYVSSGLPVVTSPNPSLRRVCVRFGVGVASSDIGLAIQEVTNNIEIFRHNVKKYSETFSASKNNMEFAESIEKEFAKKCSLSY